MSEIREGNFKGVVTVFVFTDGFIVQPETEYPPILAESCSVVEDKTTLNEYASPNRKQEESWQKLRNRIVRAVDHNEAVDPVVAQSPEEKEG